MTLPQFGADALGWHGHGELAAFPRGAPGEHQRGLLQGGTSPGASVRQCLQPCYGALTMGA